MDTALHFHGPMRLFDCHAHTCDLSYCCDEGITVDTYVAALARSDEAAGVALTNHGFAVYFPNELAWSWRYMWEPGLWDQWREWGNRRLTAHLDEVDRAREHGVFSGLEVELMSDGRLTVEDALRPRLDCLIGSVHVLPEQFSDNPPEGVAWVEPWWTHTERLAASGIDILGHPFRWLAAIGGPLPDSDLIQRVVHLAKQHRIAVEINSHQVIPGDVELLQRCREADIPVAFGTDSHRAEEILDFGYHRDVLKRAGVSLEELVLWEP